MNEIKLKVDHTAGDGMRLDRYCATREDAISRSRLKNGAHEILVNGKPVKFSHSVKPNDSITIRWEDPEPDAITGEDIPLDIIFENADVTVVDKPQGMVTHPAAGNWTGTLVHALLWRWKQNATKGNPRPGIVHRLDKDTSGIIITARNPETEAWLQEQFRERKTRKIYAAILRGVPRVKSGQIRLQLVRDPKNRKRFSWTDNLQKGKSSLTAFKVIRTFGPYTLVLFRLHTGRTHQLRVHSKFIGCPILGDPVYGKKDPLFPDIPMMLHARSLRIRVSKSGAPLTFNAPLPKRFKETIKALREKYGI